VTHVFSYETDCSAVPVAERAARDVGGEYVARGCLTHFASDVPDILKKSGPDTVILCIAGTECTDISRAKKWSIPEGKSALHAFHSRTFFFWHAGVHALAHAIGPTRLIHVCELPECREKRDDDELTRFMGKPITTNASEWNHATRRRLWRSSPQISSASHLKPCVTSVKPLRTMRDGSVWAPGDASARSSPTPVVLRRYWFHLVERHSQTGYATLESWERLTIDCLKVKLRTGQKAFAGVNFFLEHLGLADTPVAEITDLFPCKGVVSTLTGAPPQNSNEESAACGQHRFCDHCCEGIRVLGGAWHLPSATEVIYAAIAASLDHWLGKQAADFNKWEELPHECALAPFPGK
jgi:hypothetical protein